MQLLVPLLQSVHERNASVEVLRLEFDKIQSSSELLTP